MAKICIISSQAGSANAFIPLIRHIQKENELKIFAFNQSIAIFEKESFEFQPCKSFDCFLQQALDELTDILITGTGCPKIEIPAWVWAKNKKIKSIAFNDQWTDYWERFTLSERYDSMPDTIAVIDEYVKEKTIRLGCPGDKIVVTGHPLFKEISEIKREPIKGRILFVSEPYGEGYPERSFDEFKAIEDITHSLKGREGFHLNVRLHPRESQDKFDEYSLQISSNEKKKDLALSSFVIGIESILLYEASLAGIPTCCYSPEGIPTSDYLRSQPNIIHAKTTSDLEQFLFNNQPTSKKIDSLNSLERFDTLIRNSQKTTKCSND